MAKTIIHGAKIRLYPDAEQAYQFDSWRVKSMKLWNLLLGMQQAAYSGEKFRPELKWRQIWADVAQLNYDLAVLKYEKKIAEEQNKVAKPPKLPQINLILPRSCVLGEPHLFIWENDLLKMMARLKQQPLTQWIGEIHSHAAQAVCKDMIKALQAMLRERAKGVSGRNTGFPRFKKTSAYAEGSVYFANTQLDVAHGKRRIKFAMGVGEMKAGHFGHIPKNAKLMGGRINRIGEEWWLSAQFRYETSKALPKTGKVCGIKVAAKAVYTIFDGEEIEQVITRQTRRGIKRREKLVSRQQSRRKKGKKGFYEAAGFVAQYHADEQNRRNDTLHKGSRAIVNKFDEITIDKMDVAALARGKVKSLRKYVRGAAMARAAHFVKYKAEEAGRCVNETHVLFPSTQVCSVCGTINPQMVDGRRLMTCTKCGNKMQRQMNAAVNEFEQGRITKDATLALNQA